jgi:hypothetical protein
LSELRRVRPKNPFALEYLVVADEPDGDMCRKGILRDNGVRRLETDEESGAARTRASPCGSTE